MFSSLSSRAAKNLCIAFAGAQWDITAGLVSAPGHPDALDGRVTFRVDDRFALVRRDFAGGAPLKHELPFAASWKILEEKYQRDNWCDDGYYRVGPHEAAAKTPFQDWQVGWVGGGMVPFPMLESFVVLYEAAGNARWLERAEAIAAQCLTWVASYDYDFPPAS